MMKNFIAACMLLLSINLKAIPVKPANGDNYWVTETGPRSNPYTVIRLYNEDHNQFLEILINGYRLKTNRPALVKRLNSLANTANPDNTGNIAAILRIRSCRISSVTKTTNRILQLSIK